MPLWSSLVAPALSKAANQCVQSLPVFALIPPSVMMGFADLDLDACPFSAMA